MWPLGLRFVILLSRHTFFFFFPSAAEPTEGFFQLFHGSSVVLIEETKIANDSEGVGISRRRSTGFEYDRFPIRMMH